MRRWVVSVLLLFSMSIQPATAVVYYDGTRVGEMLVCPDNSGTYAVIWDEALQALGGLNIPPMKQDGSYDCWATCGAMIVNYKFGLNLYPVDFVYTAYGITDGNGDRPGTWELFKSGMNRYGLSATQHPPMSYEQVSAQISRGEPVMFVGKTPRGNYHDVLIVNASKDVNGNTLYTYNDPWLGKQITTVGGTSQPDMFYMAGEWVTWSSTRWGFYKLAS